MAKSSDELLKDFEKIVEKNIAENRIVLDNWKKEHGAKALDSFKKSNSTIKAWVEKEYSTATDLQKMGIALAVRELMSINPNDT